jgi:hypothetical protein
MKNLKDIILEKLKISSNSKVIGELDNFDNFAKEYHGDFSKGVILFNEDSLFYKKAINIISKRYSGVKSRLICDRIAGNSMTKEYRYYVSILTSQRINVSCVDRGQAKSVSFMTIQNMGSDKQIKLTYSVKDPDESIEKTYVNIILNNIINGKFD